MEDENAPGSVICVNAVRNEAGDAAGSFASVALAAEFVQTARSAVIL